MDMKRSEKIIKVAAKIEAVLNECPTPTPNQSIPRRIHFLAGQLSGCDHYAMEKAYEIAHWASIFYSARKHAKYPGGSSSLWTKMALDLLERIRTQAKSREAAGD
ncbi:MAG TPA: hypothetical protein PKH10_00200 [bacterium]|nr:hypothetical protein [bacterium]